MPDRQALRVAPVALDLAWNDPRANLAAIDAAVAARLSASGAPPEDHLFVFPELTLTGFVTKEPPAFRVEPADETVQALAGLARKHRAAIAAGFPEVNPKDPSKPLNALALFGSDGRLVARYHKTHLFTWGQNPESQGYTAGECGVIAEYRGWKIAFSICFDVRFPPLFHQYAKAGADLILASSCWIGGPHKTYQYRTINSAHAILSQAYVAAVNRSGKDPFFEYDGAEYVFSPFGEQVYEGKGLKLDPEELAAARRLVVRPSDRPSYSIASA